MISVKSRVRAVAEARGRRWVWQASLTQTRRLKGLCLHSLAWVKENFFDSGPSSLGDCEDTGAITGKGTREEKAGWCVFSVLQMLSLQSRGHVYVAIAVRRLATWVWHLEESVIMGCRLKSCLFQTWSDLLFLSGKIVNIAKTLNKQWTFMIQCNTQYFSLSLFSCAVLLLSFSSFCFPKAINQGKNAFLSEAAAQFGKTQTNDTLSTTWSFAPFFCWVYGGSPCFSEASAL